MDESDFQVSHTIWLTRGLEMHFGSWCRRLRIIVTVGVPLMLTSAAILAGEPKAPTRLCIGSACAQDAPSTGGMIKWHPGHYMSLRGKRQPALEMPLIDAIGNETVLQGILVEWKWSDIEKSPGVFDFSQIDQYLARVKALPTHKGLVIRIEERGFGTPNANSHAPMPSDMFSAAYDGGDVWMSNGIVARIWVPAVMDRMIALYQALAARYDTDPNVEGISSEETAVGFAAPTAPTPADYSAAGLLQQYQRLATASRAAWAHSNVFIQTNFLGNNTQMESLVKTLVANQAFMGGPDINPPSWVAAKGLSQAEQVLQGIAGNGDSGTDYRGIVAVKSEVQTPDYRAGFADATPAGMYQVAYGQNHCNYMFWDRYTWSLIPAQNWDAGILPFIRSVQGKTVSACPSSFQGRCSSN
jgi:hypothetical protein